MRTKLGTTDVESKLSAMSQLRSPTREKRSDVRKAKRRVIPICANDICVKNRATTRTMAPVNIPRITHPVINPDIITQYGVGETSISSIVFWNFAI